MKRTIDELLAEFKGIVGEDDREEVIGFLEDLTDSYAEPAEPAEDMSGRVAELEDEVKAWKARYKNRFYGEIDDKEVEEETEEEKKEPDGEDIKIKDLFKEKED